jgi:hypothetical protein
MAGKEGGRLALWGSDGVVWRRNFEQVKGGGVYECRLKFNCIASYGESCE